MGSNHRLGQCQSLRKLASRFPWVGCSYWGFPRYFIWSLSISYNVLKISVKPKTTIRNINDDFYENTDDYFC
jgi:hypothetical protein